MNDNSKTAIVAGVSTGGLGESLCIQLADAGYQVAGIARSDKHHALINSLGEDRYMGISCDLTNAADVNEAVSQVEEYYGPASVYIHNAARLHMQPFLETDAGEFESLWRTMCLGAVNGIQRVLPAMLERKLGSLVLIGATASVKAGANFSAFSSAKFALRGLAQSMARELGPKGIHVIHPVIDGVMWGDRARDTFKMTEEQCLKPESVAQTCLQLIEQEPSSWTHELDIRPYQESF